MKSLDTSKTYLITGGAGFIGFFLSRALLEKGARVIAIDNMNDYYEVSLKEARLTILRDFPGYKFVRGDIGDKETVFGLFETHRPDIVVNLAAQAGVRTVSTIRTPIYSPISWGSSIFWRPAGISRWSILSLPHPARCTGETPKFRFPRRIRWTSR